MWARVDACAYVATVCRSLGENVTAPGRGRNLAWSIAAVVMPLSLLAGGIYSLTVLLGASFAAVTVWRGNVWAAIVAHTVDVPSAPGTTRTNAE